MRSISKYVETILECDDNSDGNTTVYMIDMVLFVYDSETCGIQCRAHCDRQMIYEFGGSICYIVCFNRSENETEIIVEMGYELVYSE